jgi:Uma2 family endonuclease
MPTQTRTGPYSFGDFLELIQEDQKADLLDGAIYMASPESMDHNDLVAWLTTILRQFIEERGLGRITVNKVAFRLGARSGPEPDVAFVATDRAHLIKPGYVDGPPDLAIEIVSLESIDRDYEIKRRTYEQHGVREYWIIDPDERRATFLVRSDSGFTEAPLQAGRFHSTVLPGFNLDPNWLWQRPLPHTLPLVQQLLGG